MGQGPVSPLGKSYGHCVWPQQTRCLNYSQDKAKITIGPRADFTWNAGARP